MWQRRKVGFQLLYRGALFFRGRRNACKLTDLGTVRPKFTWCGPIYHVGNIYMRSLIEPWSIYILILEFPEVHSKVLTGVEFLDHHHILISPVAPPHNVAPCQLKFESAWLLDKSYHDIIKSVWTMDIILD